MKKNELIGAGLIAAFVAVLAAGAIFSPNILTYILPAESEWMQPPPESFPVAFIGVVIVFYVIFALIVGLAYLCFSSLRWSRLYEFFFPPKESEDEETDRGLTFEKAGPETEAEPPSPAADEIAPKADAIAASLELEIPRLKLAGPALAGLLIVAGFFGGLIAWSALAPLSNAAIASGKVKVENERKTIQHLEGGIVSRILVRDGSEVRAGQVLIELDQTKARARLQRLEGQLEAVTIQLALLQDEISTVSKLLDKGLTSKPRLLALQRRAAELVGDGKRLRAEIDDAKDILNRSKIKSEIEGIVVGLNVHTTGGVIKAGDKLMDIVPKDERLIIQAYVNPIDIDVVHKGLEATVYLTPYNRRNLTPIRGRVTNLSADRFVNDSNDQSYYLADIELIDDPSKAIKGATLYPGMPAEVMILTGKQTVLESLFQPILQSLNRAFRES